MPGPGRPAIGGKTFVRLGELKAEVEEYAKREGLKEGEAIRRLIELGLNRDAATRPAPGEGDES